MPLIITGPDVVYPGTESDALVNTTDLFATVAELAGVSLVNHPYPLDSISVLPYLTDPDLPSIREVVFSERFEPNGFGTPTDVRQMIRNERYKLIQQEGLPDEFYDMENRLLEETDLLQAGMTTDEESEYDSLLYKLDNRLFD